ncbi:MAG: hypothetical protein FIA95_12385 [Gemmatimonadetes bacterium]|nr:hypothetical protein [Gemmatimonadota bacterium]
MPAPGWGGRTGRPSVGGAGGGAGSPKVRRLVYVDDGAPEAGTRHLRRSCEERGVAFLPVDVRLFDFHPSKQLHAGDLLYRPAVSLLSQRVEQFLYAPGVATFYAEPDGIYRGCVNAPLAFQRSGLPAPRSIPLFAADRATLADFARRLGGFPVVFKVPGFSTGIGVGKVDSLDSLVSLAELARVLGQNPWLMAYVPDAVHWRLVVVGDRVVASYRNVTREEDFRSSATRDPTDYRAEPPEGMAELAVRSSRVLRLEFGGVDVLEHPASGRLYLLENNFPCYFAQAQDVAGVDISGAMVDHLLRKAESLEGLGA